jgi:feruloyl esterase
MNDPNRDVFAALEQWVEKGVAPEQWIGQGTVPGDSSKTMTRPICQYPKVAQSKGSGDVNDAANFTCAAPSARR